MMNIQHNKYNQINKVLENNPELIPNTLQLELKLLEISDDKILIKLDKNKIIGLFIEDNILPHSISNFNELEELFIINSKLDVIPEFIYSLNNLKILSITNNNIQMLDERINNLRNLKSLYLRGNKLKDLPMFSIKLEILSIDNNNFSKFPEISSLSTSLKRLFIDKNNISSIPDYIANFILLERLDLNKKLINSSKKIMYILLEQYCAIYNEFEKPWNVIYFHKKLSRESARIKLHIENTETYIAYNDIFGSDNSYLDLDHENLLLELPENIDEYQNIVNLDLTECPLHRLPKSFTRLNIKSLKLNCEKFKKLPDELFQLEKLEKLTLIGNRMKPKRINFRLFSQLRELKELNLKEISLYGFSNLFSEQTKITTISINSCKMKKLPPNFVKLPIENLTINDYYLEPIHKELSKMTKLRKLTLKLRSSIEKEFDFSILTNIEGLGLDLGLSLDEIPKSVFKLTKLKSLYMRFPKNISGEIIKLINLEEIDIEEYRSNKLPDIVYELKNLRKLSIRNSEITEISVKIANLQKLEEVDFEQSWIKELPEEFYELKNLRKLNLKKTSIRKISTKIANLQKLEELKLYRQKIPQEITRLKNLRVFEYNVSDYTDQEIKEIVDILNKQISMLNKVAS